MLNDDFEDGFLEWKRIALFKVPPNASTDDRFYRLDDNKKYRDTMEQIKLKYPNVKIEGSVFSQIEVFASLPRSPEAARRLKEMAEAKADRRAGQAAKKAPTGIARGRWDRSGQSKSA